MKIAILGVPYDLDRPRDGMGNAPQALLDAALIRRLEASGCIVASQTMIASGDGGQSREERVGATQKQLAQAVTDAQAGGLFPLILGGDCLNALGALAGIGAPSQTGIAWFDAHGDFNTLATTPSGYLGGMPLACAVGRGLDGLRQTSGLEAPVPEAQVALLGVRDLDPPEEQALLHSAVRVLRTVDLQRAEANLDQALSALAGVEHLYLHIDVDVLDPTETPGVDFPTPAGLKLHELQALLVRVVEMGNLAVCSCTAVNPDKDTDGRTVEAALHVIETVVAQKVKDKR
jgi:arginase